MQSWVTDFHETMNKKLGRYFKKYECLISNNISHVNCYLRYVDRVIHLQYPILFTISIIDSRKYTY